MPNTRLRHSPISILLRYRLLKTFKIININSEFITAIFFNTPAQTLMMICNQVFKPISKGHNNEPRAIHTVGRWPLHLTGTRVAFAPVVHAHWLQVVQCLVSDLAPTCLVLHSNKYIHTLLLSSCF